MTATFEPGPGRGAGRSRRRRLVLAAAVYPLGLVVLSAIHLLVPARSGPLAISAILAPHLFLLALLLVPMAAVREARLLRIALLLALAVFLVRFGPGAVSLPVAASDGARREVIATWNLLADDRDTGRTMAALHRQDAAVIGLQELSERMATAIEEDLALTTRYPHRLMAPRPNVLGMGLLSAYPIVASGRLGDPPLLWATLDLGDGRRLTVVGAHPLPARIRGLDTIPIGFDPTERDAAIGRVRTVVDEALGRGEPVILLGDFNVTDREPAYRDLTAGLTDAQRAVGSWPASTWRPGFAVEWPFGLLRIDFLLAGPGVRPLAAAPDCTPTGSDHCMVRGVFELR